MGRTAHIGEERVAQIRRWAEELGFSGVGFSKAERLETEEPRLAAWLAEERHGRMAYLEKNFDKRLDPRFLLPGTKTVISLLYNHYTDVRQEDPEAPKISTYAFGEDYHFVVKWKLKELLKWMRRDWGEIAGRVYVDSAPILERAWAAKRSPETWLQNRDVYGDIGSDARFRDAFVQRLKQVHDDGVAASIRTYLRCGGA